MNNSRLLISALVLALAVVAAIPTAAAADSPPATTAQVLQAVTAAASAEKVPSDLQPPLADSPNDQSYNELNSAKCAPDPPTVKMGPCLFGDTSGKRTMVLFGDSHAMMWFAGFDTLAKRRHWRLAYLGKSGCGAPALTFFDSTRTRPFKECDEWKPYAIGRIRKLHPALIVVTSEFLTPEDAHRKQFSDSQWTTGLTKTLRLLTMPGAKRVVLGDIPYLPQSAPDCLAAHMSDMSTCSAPASEAVKSDHAAAEKKAAAATGTAYISVVPWFCTKQCMPVIDKTVVYFDEAHISRTYAIYLSGALESALSPAMNGK
jgi:hypothetical protein